MKGELRNLDIKIFDAKKYLKNFIVNLFTDLILQLEGTTIETFNQFFENYKIFIAQSFYRFYFKFKNKQRNTQASSKILPSQRQI